MSFSTNATTGLPNVTKIDESSSSKEKGTNKPDKNSNKSKEDINEEGDEFKKLLKKLKKEGMDDELTDEMQVIQYTPQQQLLPNVTEQAEGEGNIDAIGAATEALSDGQETMQNYDIKTALPDEISKTQSTDTNPKPNLAELESMFNKISVPDTLKGDQMSFVLKNTPFSGSKFTIQVSDGNLNTTMTMPNSINPTVITEASNYMRDRLANTFPDLNINIKVERQQEQRDGGQNQQGKQQQNRDEDNLFI